MKKRLLYLIALLAFLSSSLYAQPVMNGSFDGVAVWGSPVATNPTAGWEGANAQALYVTSDDDYFYFGAEVSAASWQSFGFVINTNENENGISSDVWGFPITYGHAFKPKFVIKGNFNGYAELREWNGSTGNNLIGEIASGNRGISTSFVEVRILKSALSDPARLDVQFYISGNNGNEHATFDAVPEDARADSWNTSTILSQYANDVDFSAPGEGDDVVDAPVLTGPASGATAISSLAAFSWEGVDNALEYVIEIATDAGFTNIVLTSVRSGLTYTVPNGSGLRPSTTYYWRVLGRSSITQVGPWSDVRSFETVPSFTVYFNNPSGWDNVYVYAFDPGHYVDWSGELMTAPTEGSDWYSYEIPTTFGKVIFNNNAGSQTADLVRNSTGWFDGTTWFDEEPGVTLSYTLSGTEGWRFMSSPFSDVSYSQLLDGLHTQGFAGAAFIPTQSQQSNVRVLSAASGDPAIQSWVSIANGNDIPVVGSGFTIGVYAKDTPDQDLGGGTGFPKTRSVTGRLNTGDVSIALNPAGDFTLVGNPYSSTVDFSLTNRSGLSEVIYVYDYVTPNPIVEGDQPNNNPSVGVFRAWNGEVGSLGNYLVSPFQSFLVYRSGETASLEFSSASQSETGTIFRGKENTAELPVSLSLELVGQGLYSSAYIHFSESASAGLDNRDALKLYPFASDYALLQTYAVDGTGLDINHYPMPVGRTEIPLDMLVTRSGSFTIQTNDLNLPSDWIAILFDDLTGEEHLLYSGSNIRLDLEAVAAKSVASSMQPHVVSSNGSTRFRLIVEPGQTTNLGSDSMLPEIFTLSQNYPNPFNPTTSISFTLPADVAGSGLVRLTVFDMLGREVARLVDGQLSAGTHTVRFDASGLGSGIYVYRLEAGGMVMSRRMTFVK